MGLRLTVLRCRQISAQHSIIDSLVTQGVDEIRIDRYIYADIPVSYDLKRRTAKYDIKHTTKCVLAGFENKNASEIISCYSAQPKYQFLSKSVSVSHSKRFICPFHWNHWRCTVYDYEGSPMERENVKCYCETRYLSFTDRNNPEEETNRYLQVGYNGVPCD